MKGMLSFLGWAQKMQINTYSKAKWKDFVVTIITERVYERKLLQTCCYPAWHPLHNKININKNRYLLVQIKIFLQMMKIRIMVLKEIVILAIQTCMDRVSLKNKCNSCYNSSRKTLLQTHLPIWQVVLLASCLQPCSIRLPNGSQTHVSCIGIATISPNMKIHNVLYLPNFKLNLLFIYKFTIDNKCFVNCMLVCLLQDLQNGKLMGIDKMRHGLYFLVPYSQASVESHIPKQLSSTCNSSIP